MLSWVYFGSLQLLLLSPSPFFAWQQIWNEKSSPSTEHKCANQRFILKSSRKINFLLRCFTLDSPLVYFSSCTERVLFRIFGECWNWSMWIAEDNDIKIHNTCIYLYNFLHYRLSMQKRTVKTKYLYILQPFQNVAFVRNTIISTGSFWVCSI